MTIRVRLVLVYASILATGLIGSTASIWSVSHWRNETRSLERVRLQGDQTTKIRTSIFRQIEYGLDYISGEVDAADGLEAAHREVQQQIDLLIAEAHEEDELERIEEMNETLFELSWLLNKPLPHGRDSLSAQVALDINAKIREIGDEASDALQALHQYYNGTIEDAAKSVETAGLTAAGVVAISILLILGQLFYLLIGIQRWLVKPIAIVGRATDEISSGNFDTRIDLPPVDEWGQVSASINDMAQSLSSLEKQLQLQARLAALGEVAAYTAHNIQNPLASIRAASQVTLKDIDDKDSVEAETLQDIIVTVDRLTQWVGRFLTFAKPLDLQKESVFLHEITDRAITVVTGPEQASVEFRKEYDRTLTKISVDPILLEQCVGSVITNACEAGADSITITTRRKEIDKTAGYQIIEVRDNGKGISDAIKEKLFKAFVTDKKSGTGLGLAQTKKIVDQHNGSVTIESIPDTETILTISLPEVDSGTLEEERN